MCHHPSDFTLLRCPEDLHGIVSLCSWREQWLWAGL